MTELTFTGDVGLCRPNPFTEDPSHKYITCRDIEFGYSLLNLFEQRDELIDIIGIIGDIAKSNRSVIPNSSER